MIDFEDLRIKENELLVKHQWNGLLDHTKKYFNKLFVDENGNIGIGSTPTPSSTLHVNGKLVAKDATVDFLQAHAANIGNGKLKANIADIRTINAGSITASKLRNIGSNNKKEVMYNPENGEIGYDNSTRRDKRNITPLNVDFGKIMQLQPRKYTRPSDPESWEIGYIAEEAKSLGLDDLIIYDEENKPDGINYRKLCLYLVEIVREHERKLNPGSPYLEIYIEKEVPKPDLQSNKKAIEDYLNYLGISYDNTDTKEDLLNKIDKLDELDELDKLDE